MSESKTDQLKAAFLLYCKRAKGRTSYNFPNNFRIWNSLFDAKEASSDPEIFQPGFYFHNFFLVEVARYYYSNIKLYLTFFQL
jgi:hypothetical protein